MQSVSVSRSLFFYSFAIYGKKNGASEFHSGTLQTQFYYFVRKSSNAQVCGCRGTVIVLLARLGKKGLFDHLHK